MSKSDICDICGANSKSTLYTVKSKHIRQLFICDACIEKVNKKDEPEMDDII